MVHRSKSKIPPRELMHPKWIAVKALVLRERNGHTPNTDCYRDSTLNSLLKLYKNKCAICERSRGEELEVDHYRPRKRRDNLTGETQYNQPGYYWLTYEWFNLIPLCSKCNGKKSNKFPLAGFTETNRVDDHENHTLFPGFDSYNLNWLQIHEKPLLINPEWDKTPERHFSFHKNGKIIGRTDEGIETIKICCLNRNDLVRERQKIKFEIIQEIKDAVVEYDDNRNENELKGALKTVFRKCKRNLHQDEDHSLFHLFIYNYFDYFIGSSLENKIRRKVVMYFEDFTSRM